MITFFEHLTVIRAYRQVTPLPHRFGGCPLDFHSSQFLLANMDRLSYLLHLVPSNGDSLHAVDEDCSNGLSIVPTDSTMPSAIETHGARPSSLGCGMMVLTHSQDN